MGLWANLPFALAPGMGLNAYFVFTVVLGMGVWLAASIVRGLRRGTPIPSHVNATDTNNRNMEITDDQLHSH